MATPTTIYPYSSTKELDTSFAIPQFKGITSAAQVSGLIDPNFISSILREPKDVAFFVNALRYGGYTTGDIINELKRKEMIFKKDPNASSVSKFKVIDPELKRSDYINSAEGIDATTKTRQYIPTIQLTGNLNPEILKYGINMPDEAFKILSPIYDIKSEEFKTAVNNVKSAFYDLSMQQLQAESEQEKVVADTNMTKFKETIERQYGIALSDNATAAWKQLESLGETMSQRGLQGSGMEQETIDSYLRAVRNKDAQNRQAKLSAEETQTASFYKASATPQQIQALIAEDQAKGLPRDQWRATKWGLVPSDDILQKYSMESLKQRFPDQTEEELKAYKNAVLDEQGNYRSTLYSNYYSELNKKSTEKKAAAGTKVLQESLNKDEQMRRIYDTAEPFSSATYKDKETAEKIISQQPVYGNQEQTPAQREATFAAAGIKPPLGKPEIIGETKRETPAPQKIQPVIPQEKLEQISKSLSGIQGRIAKEGITDVSGKVLQSPTIPIGPETKPKGYTGVSLVDYLTSTGQASDPDSRAKLAASKGIKKYTQTGDQNTQLLKSLRGF